MTTSSSSARPVFWYLLAIFALFWAALGSGQILFSAIDQLLPDPAAYYSPSFGVLRFGIASLIIAAPALYLSLRMINSAIAKKELSLDSAIRRWCTYLVLLIAAIVALGDLIGVLYTFLQGELVLRSGLKFLAVLAIAGAVLAYFGMDLQRDAGADRRLQFFGYGFLAAVLAVLVLGFAINGSPAQARAAQMDSQRISDLQSIASGIDSAFNESEPKALPQSLEVLVDSGRLFAEDLVDPAGASYGYRVISAEKYELCATFETEQLTRDDGIWDAAWQHSVGEKCFEKTVSDWSK